jgi:hypothetical protein
MREVKKRVDVIGGEIDLHSRERFEGYWVGSRSPNPYWSSLLAIDLC